MLTNFGMQTSQSLPDINGRRKGILSTPTRTHSHLLIKTKMCGWTSIVLPFLYMLWLIWNRYFVLMLIIDVRASFFCMIVSTCEWILHERPLLVPLFFVIRQPSLIGTDLLLGAGFFLVPDTHSRHTVKHLALKQHTIHIINKPLNIHSLQ
jgi:hypothetical protein